MSVLIHSWSEIWTGNTTTNWAQGKYLQAGLEQTQRTHGKQNLVPANL